MSMSMIGQRFGRLVVLSVAETGAHKKWLCLCDCGQEKVVRSQLLRNGQTKSCGCLSAEASANRKRTHGLSDTRTYRIWNSMWARCTVKSQTSFPRYGAVGVTVCERWRSFEAFLTDMGECPDGMEIDRKDGSKGYEPANCRWATRSEQAQNRRVARFVEFRGERLSVTQWAARIGVTPSAMANRLDNWPVARAVTEPRRSAKQ